MPLFGHEQSSSEPQLQWRKAVFDGYEVWAQPIDGKREWRISLPLPEDVDPSSVVIGSYAVTGGQVFYTVQHHPKDTLVWSFDEINSFGDGKHYIPKGGFGVHIESAFQKQLEETLSPADYQKAQTTPPLNL